MRFTQVISAFVRYKNPLVFFYFVSSIYELRLFNQLHFCKSFFFCQSSLILLLIFPLSSLCLLLSSVSLARSLISSGLFSDSFVFFRISHFLNLLCIIIIFRLYVSGFSVLILPNIIIFSNITLIIKHYLFNYQIETFEVWRWRKIEIIKWIDTISKENVLRRVRGNIMLWLQSSSRERKTE